MKLLRGTVLAAIVLAVFAGSFLFWAKPAEGPSDLLFGGGDIITMADLQSFTLCGSGTVESRHSEPRRKLGVRPGRT